MKSTKRVRNYKRNLRKSKKKMRKSRKMKGGAASLDLSMWAIDTDKGKINFSKKDSDRLTEQYLQQNFQLETNMRGYTYRIDLLNLTQTNLKTKKSRKLFLPNDDRFKWSVKTETGTHPYDLKTSHELTKIYVDTKKTAEEKTYIYIRGAFEYKINLHTLKQINEFRRTEREVFLPEFLSGGGGGGASALGTSFKGVNTTRPGGGSSASRSKRPGGGSAASSMTVTLGDGSYEPHIDALKPSFRHMDDRKTLLIMSLIHI